VQEMDTNAYRGNASANYSHLAPLHRLSNAAKQTIITHIYQKEAKQLFPYALPPKETT
jgi:hypothetical protein